MNGEGDIRAVLMPLVTMFNMTPAYTRLAMGKQSEYAQCQAACPHWIQVKGAAACT